MTPAEVAALFHHQEIYNGRKAEEYAKWANDAKSPIETELLRLQVDYYMARADAYGACALVVQRNLVKPLDTAGPEV